MDMDFTRARAAMVGIIRRMGVEDERVLSAMEIVRRHVFIPESTRDESDPYGDHPCPIGRGQTISQPYIVAYMTERMGIRPGDKVLEVGTGSGYQAAVLAELGAEVYSIEIIPELAEHARQALDAEGYGRVCVRRGDGYMGWSEHAPYAVVLVTCAPEDVPAALTAQLAEGGRMVIPVGGMMQRLLVLRKEGGRVSVHEDLPVRFVPMVHGGRDE